VPTTERTYRSPRREARARETRARIVTAAHALFLENGFAGTSVQDIAAAAEVARPTVLTVFGTKAQLLRAVVDVAMAGSDEPVPVPQQRWFQPVWAATTGAECLDAYAGACLLIARRSALVIELVRRASDEGPETADQWAQLQANRRTGAASIARRVKQLGDLAPGLTLPRATDRIWMVNDSAHYAALVHECGWSERAFRGWLGEQLRRAVLTTS
jgi:AcrR family transcriptional regulator